jgi:hypothetical protein
LVFIWRFYFAESLWLPFSIVIPERQANLDDPIGLDESSIKPRLEKPRQFG